MLRVERAAVAAAPGGGPMGGERGVLLPVRGGGKVQGDGPGPCDGGLRLCGGSASATKHASKLLLRNLLHQIALLHVLIHAVGGTHEAEGTFHAGYGCHPTVLRRREAKSVQLSGRRE